MKIRINNSAYSVELFNTPTAKAISAKLPLSGNANVWGNEIYFSIPVKCELEPDAKDILEVGDLTYYPPLQAICIFFGPTPMSTDEKPVAAGAVNIFGKIICETEALQMVKQGDKVEILSD